MSNNFFNFNLPALTEKYADDWASFKSTMQDNFDHYAGKVWDLYILRCVNKMTARIVQRFMDLRQIPYTANDTLAEKKFKIRKHVSRYADKGLDDIYLDAAEDISSGGRGALYTGIAMYWRWEHSRWYGTTDADDYTRWPSDNPLYDIFFDVKTLVGTELDQIVALLREGSMLPAFYQMYLVDSSFNVLRTV